MLFKDVTATYENRRKPVNTLCTKCIVRLLDVSVSGAYSYHSGLKGEVRYFKPQLCNFLNMNMYSTVLINEEFYYFGTSV
jgi:hypothetical protein